MNLKSAARRREIAAAGEVEVEAATATAGEVEVEAAATATAAALLISKALHTFGQRAKSCSN